MLKKRITYEDFEGNEVTEDHYFHLSKADLIEMEMAHKGGMEQYLKRIVESEDGKAIIAEFKELILASYGQRSEDGKRFVKTAAMREEFQSTEAYSALFMELCTDPDKASEFINGIVPSGLEREMAKLAGEPRAESPNVIDYPFGSRSRVLTQLEIAEMDSDELKSGLATGKYKLTP